MSLVGSGPEEDVMSTINITPFTDVLLVLLIIFMILTSLLKPPPVPQAKNKLKVENSPLVMIIHHNPATNKDEVQVGPDIIALNEIDARMKEYADTFQRDHDIIIKAAPNVRTGTVLRVMYAGKQSGFTKFGLANKIQGAPDTANQQ
jgi:biopolymer transport protein ExbD